jgi:WD40 repeat protein
MNTRASEVLGNPFPGLRPFEADETHLFFGRDGQSSAIVGLLAAHRMIAVVGPSGSGKSSLVRAGLLPLLDGGFMAGAGSFWRFALMTPGDNPIRRLAAALASPSVLGGGASDLARRQAQIEAVLSRSRSGLAEAFRQARLPPHENLLVLVDQFEELFRFADLRGSSSRLDEASAFVNLLIEAASLPESRIFVVLTMRSDFLGDCAQFQNLPETLNRGQYLIPRMTRDDIRAAIEGPIAVGGATITAPLVQALLNDVGDDPDQLPVLQHALMRTWEAWRNENQPKAPVDLDHYKMVGTLRYALSRHADQAYDALKSDRQREIAKLTFQRLCERTLERSESRHPSRIDDIAAVCAASTAEVTEVVDCFRTDGRTFLRPAAGVALDERSVIDISHEALIRQWERLRRWVAEEADSAGTYLHLVDAARRHRAKKAGLWRDLELKGAQLWRMQRRPTQAWAQRYASDFSETMNFLEESRKAQRLRGLGYALLFGLFPLLIFAVGAGITIYAKNQKLDSLNVQLKQKADEAMSSKFAVQSLLEGDSEIAGILAIEARRVAATAEADIAVLQAFGRPAVLPELTHPLVKSISVDRSGARVLTSGGDGSLRLWDSKRGVELARVDASDEKPALTAPSPLLSADGSMVFRAGAGSGLNALRFKDGALEVIAVEGEGPHLTAITRIAATSDGATLATADAKGNLGVWRVGPDLVSFSRALTSHTDAVIDLAFSTDGTMLASIGRDRTVRIHRIKDGKLMHESVSEKATPRYVRFIAQGFVVIDDLGMHLLASPDFKRILDDQEGRERVGAAAVTPDASQLVTGGTDGTFTIWSATSAGLAERISLPVSRLSPVGARALGRASIGSIDRSSDGQTFAIAIRDLDDETRNRIVVFSPLAPSNGLIVSTPRMRPTLRFLDEDKAIGALTGSGVIRWDISDQEARAASTSVQTAGIKNIDVGDAGKVLVQDQRNGVWVWDILEEQSSLNELAGRDPGVAQSRAPMNSPVAVAQMAYISTVPVAHARSGHLMALDVASSEQEGEPSDSRSDGARRRRMTVFGADRKRIQLSDDIAGLSSPAAIAISDDGKILAGVSGRASSAPQVLTAVQISPYRKLFEDVLDVKEQVSSLALSSDGQYLAVAISPAESTGASGTERNQVERGFRLKVYDLHLDVAKQVFSGPLGQDKKLTQLRFGNRSALLAGVLSPESSLFMFDVASKRRIDDPGRVTTEGVVSFVFAPDDKAIALLDRNKGLSVLSLGESALSIRRLPGPIAAIQVISYSPDGKLLVAGARDGSLSTWNTSSNEPVSRLRSGHTAGVSAIGFDGTGRYMVTGDQLGKLVMWDLGKVLQKQGKYDESVCASTRENLPLAAWRTYMGDAPYHRTCANLPVGNGVIDDLVAQAKKLKSVSRPQEARARFKEATALALETNDAVRLNGVCWDGVLLGEGATVIDSCDGAVKLQPDAGAFLDSRAIARAQAGNLDGAASDLRAALADSTIYRSEERAVRKIWLGILEQGRNPIDAKALEQLHAFESG